MTDTLQTLESQKHTVVAGLQFRDTATGAVIGEGLTVTAFPLDLPRLRARSVMTRSRIHAFFNIPEAQSKTDFTAEIVDRQRRFIPFSIDFQLPIDGILQFKCSSAASIPLSPDIPLLSSPTRIVPPTMAVVRADLWDTTNDSPAAWAVLEAAYADNEGNNKIVYGVADENGRVAVIFPYPESRPATPGTPVTPLNDQQWQVQLQVRYQAIAVSQTLPNLCKIFDQSYCTFGNSASETIEVTLKFGEELIVAPDGNSRLNVIAA